MMVWMCYVSKLLLNEWGYKIGWPIIKFFPSPGCFWRVFQIFTPTPGNISIIVWGEGHLKIFENGETHKKLGNIINFPNRARRQWHGNFQKNRHDFGNLWRTDLQKQPNTQKRHKSIWDLQRAQSIRTFQTSH